MKNSMQLLDGKATAAAIRAELAVQTAALSSGAGRAPGLAVLLVGSDPASQTYVRNKERACREVGIHSEVIRLEEATGQQELLEHIDRLNARADIDGILVQLPLPGDLDSRLCLERIAPHKDVDGFHPENMGRLILGLPGLRPCTPAGVMELLRRHGISPAGKHAVVVGRSNIVGKPLAVMLGAPGPEANATVTVCHSGTPDLAAVCRSADILCVAIGRPGLVDGSMVKENAIVVDVGISVTPDGLRGDCDFASVRQKASWLTPVPGGVGPMTIAMLLRNTLQAFQRHTGQ